MVFKAQLSGAKFYGVVRCFVLVQGAEMKLRPIDDCLEAQLNQAYTVSSYVKLQDIDYIAGFALCTAQLVEVVQPGPGKWLDLSKAYKQMAVHPDHRPLAVIFHHNLKGRPKCYWGGPYLRV